MRVALISCVKAKRTTPAPARATSPAPRGLAFTAPTEIRASGLWNLNHVEQRYDRVFPKALAAYVEV